ncbi:transposase [Bradyrhizobium sp. CIR18]|nr:transposase [Bradyrhizobium sp. CIR18]
MLRLDPFSGAAFVFRLKRADRIKILVWDRTGLVLVHKRPRRLQVRLANDHASYIPSWIKVLKNDKRAIFKASGRRTSCIGFRPKIPPRAEPRRALFSLRTGIASMGQL